jgi:hypothetical protein
MPRPPRASQFVLQCDPAQLSELASRYSYDEDLRVVEEIGPQAKARGYYRRDEFLELCRWKTQRSKSKVASNSAEDVEEVTRLALNACSEALRIWTPMALEGVSWATSSVLLHFAHTDPYPILDFRALEALGVTGTPNYTIGFWNGYVAACRQLSDTTGLEMRTVDRALWQWSKERTTHAGD